MVRLVANYNLLKREGLIIIRMEQLPLGFVPREFVCEDIAFTFDRIVNDREADREDRWEYKACDPRIKARAVIRRFDKSEQEDGN